MMDAFTTGIGIALGLFFAPFAIAAILLVLLCVFMIGLHAWLWLKDFCKTAWSFVLFCCGRNPF